MAVRGVGVGMPRGSTATPVSLGAVARCAGWHLAGVYEEGGSWLRSRSSRLGCPCVFPVFSSRRGTVIRTLYCDSYVVLFAVPVCLPHDKKKRKNVASEGRKRELRCVQPY